MAKYWNYIITPAFVARFNPGGRMEARHLVSEEWKEITNVDVRRSVELDGVSASEEHAEEIFRAYQTRMKERAR